MYGGGCALYILRTAEFDVLSTVWGKFAQGVGKIIGENGFGLSALSAV